MIYLENDFYSNFNSIVESNDEKSLESMFIDQISNLIAYKKSDLISLFNKIGLKVSANPSNKEISTTIANNIKSNKKLQVGLAYLIAENNNLLQQEIKKSRSNDNLSFDGDKNKPKESEPSDKKTKKPIDWNKGADAVTTISGSISLLADSITQAKTGKLATDLNTQSNIKSPEDLAKEEAKSLEDAKKKKRRRNVIIGVVVAGVIITTIIGFKKGWFGKGQINPN